MIYTYFILLNTKGEISETKTKAFLGNTPYLCAHNFDQSNLDLFFNLFIKNLNQKIMKRLLTVIAAFMLSVNFIAAQDEGYKEVYKIDYSTNSGFPFYVMGYVPEWVDGIMTDYGANYKYVQKTDDAEETSEDIVTTQGGVEYYRWTTGGGWHQYFIADGISTEGNKSLKVKALVKASENVKFNINMGWGWGSGESVGKEVEIPASDDFQEVEWEYDGILGASCNLVAQPGGATATIEWKQVRVLVPDTPVEWKVIYENDGTDLTSVMTKYFKSYVASEGEDGAIVVESLDPEKIYEEYDNAGADAKLANNWDTQFLIGLPIKLPKGLTFKLSMKMKAEKAAGSEWQTHYNMPAAGAIEGKDGFGGTYLHYNLGGIANYNFTTEWPEEPFEATITLNWDNKDVDAMDIICLNLEVLREVNKYYFKDIVVSIKEKDYEDYFADPLKAEKAALEAAITIGKAQSDYGKTSETFGALTSALETAEAIEVESAEKETLVDAANAINEAIAGLKLAEGYSKLTKEMFRNWDSATEPTTENGAAGCAYDLNIESGMPYGDGSVGLLNFADLSEFNKFVIIANGGTPRILLNRDIDEGQWNADEAESHLIDNTKGDESSWHMKYYAREDKTTTVDLETLAKEKGFAHLHSIKTVGGNVTTTDMLLYRFVSFGEAGWASFGSQFKNTLFNSDVTAYAVKFNSETGKMDLTKVEDGIVPARVGVILESEKTETLPEFDVEAADAVESDLLISNGTVKGDGESIYVLAKKAGVAGFYLLTKDEVIPAGKAYYKAPAGDGARAFIALGGDVTGIKTVESVKAANNAIYNLAGQRLVKAQKGLNIVNGKKIMK